MHSNNDGQMVAILIFFFALVVLARRRWQPSTVAYGTAHWMSEQMMQAAGMLGNVGLFLGRTMSGRLIRVKNYCHLLLVGATGSGKGVSIIFPNLLTYFRGSVVCFDIKGDLHATCGKLRASKGEQILRLAPFNGGKDSFNPLDAIEKDSPTLVDSARAMAEALAVRTGMEHDQHWNDKSVQVLTALLVLVLLWFRGKERSLNSVQEIASDPKMLANAADRLREMDGIPARLGSQLKALYGEEAGVLSKEGASVLSTVTRHLSFLDSEPVARSVATSTFDPSILLKRGTTLFVQIPGDQLEAQKGLLRCWISTLVRMIGANGDERSGEVLMLLDEASALNGLGPIEEALVRGRSAGVRLLLAYQSDSQVKSAFKEKPSLLYDNCTTQIYLGASSIETAERISKSLGDWTQMVEGYGENQSRSWNEWGSATNQGVNVSQGSQSNYSVSGRALLKPEEILTLPDDYLIAFQRGVAPILANRIKWYRDPEFKDNAVSRPAVPVWLWLLAAALGVIAWVLGN